MIAFFTNGVTGPYAETEDRIGRVARPVDSLMVRTLTTEWRAVTALGVLAIAVSSAGLFRGLPVPVSTLAWKASWVLLCFSAIAVTSRESSGSVFAQLGLGRFPGVGMGFGLIASLPMLLVFATATKRAGELETVPLLMTAILSPFSEEVLFRGYVFLQLYRRAGWSFAAAVAATAVVFGLAHLAGLAGRTSAIQLLGEMGVIAAGGAFFAWLLVRWRDDLWIPIALHAFMNLWCYAFACDEQPGSLPTNLGRLLVVAAGFAVTAAWRRRNG